MRIGPVVRKDVMRASTMLEHEEKYAIILAFDVKVKSEANLGQEMTSSSSWTACPSLSSSRWSGTPRKWRTGRGSRSSRQRSSTISSTGDLMLLSLASCFLLWPQVIVSVSCPSRRSHVFVSSSGTKSPCLCPCLLSPYHPLSGSPSTRRRS